MRLLLQPWLSLKPSFTITMGAFESILGTQYKNLALMMLGLVLFWHIYTPIHELIHVGACLMGGGTVTELALAPQYGAVFLSKIFPFIKPESDYAGQLTGFTTPNDFVYAWVDLAPYLLSLFGLTCLEWARRKHAPVLFGLGIILAFIPFMSIPGDYYEAASLLTTRIAESLDPNLARGVLVSDDVFRSVAELQKAGTWNLTLEMLVGLGVVIAIYLVLVTLAAQVLVVRRLFGSEVGSS